MFWTMHAPHHRKQQPNLLLFTGLNALRLIGLIGLVAAAIFWWPVQSDLSTNRPVALAYTIGLVLASPALWSFVIPWSQGGMLLQRIQRQTIGFWIVGAAAAFFAYYSWRLQTAWWSAQPVTAESGMVGQQVAIGLLLYIVIPGLIWTPVSSDEFEAQVTQDRLVKRYDIQTKADIAILDATLLRAQQRAAIGFANLMPAEQQELAGVMEGLITGMDTTLQRIAGNLNETAETIYGQHGKDLFSAPPFADDLAEMLDYISQSILKMGPAPASNVLSSGQPTIEIAPESRAMVTTPATHVDSQAQTVNPRDGAPGRTVQGRAGPGVAPRGSRESEDREAWDLWERLDTSLGAVFVAKDVMSLMRWQDVSAAQRLCKRWLDIGIIQNIPTRPGRYGRARQEA
jgi:hypothetical protein